MKSRSHKKWLMAGITVACLAVALFLAACANTGTATGSDNQSTSTVPVGTTTSVQINVPEPSSGYFPETWNNVNLNAGNRGCDSCHADLWTLVDGTTSPKYEQHVHTSAPGYGMHARLSACLACHVQAPLLGPDLGDLLHNAHYGNADFISRNGNCWSCHATVKEGLAYNHTGEWNPNGQQAQFLLWDDVKYTAGAGGWAAEYANTDANVAWLISRGFAGGHMTSTATDSVMDMTVELDQSVLDEKDNYVANNFDTQVIDGATYTLSLKGVKNPRTFTLDELKAMPATEIIATQVCGTNGPNGSLIGNIPMKGVSVEYLIEQCGGLLPGIVSVTTTSWTDAADGTTGVWTFPTDIEEITEQDAIIAYEYFGHELTNDQGYPAVLVYPGLMGGQWTKFPKVMDFSTVPCPKPENHEPFAGWEIFAVTSGWFSPAKDGTALTAGQEATLTGYSNAWAYPANALKQIKFSFDYGKTWKTVDVPANFDPNQWVIWTVKWTPPSAGTYVLKVNAVDAAGITQAHDASVIVVVK